MSLGKTSQQLSFIVTHMHIWIWQKLILEFIMNLFLRVKGINPKENVNVSIETCYVKSFTYFKKSLNEVTLQGNSSLLRSHISSNKKPSTRNRIFNF